MDIAYHQEGGLLRAFFTGPWTTDEICESVQTVAAQCDIRRTEFLLVDGSALAPGDVTTFDRYRLARSAVFLLKIAKVAVAGPAVMIDPDKFGERVARNRGLNLRVYTDLDEARRWLLDEKD